MSENEGETKDDSSKWDERCEGIVAIEDEQAYEDENEEENCDHDSI